MTNPPKHGQRIRLEDFRLVEAQIKNMNLLMPFNVIPDASPVLTRYGYLFPDLAGDPASTLEPTPETITGLRALGEVMAEDASDTDSAVPAAYTYLGQFIDHDITLEASSDTFEDIRKDFFLPIDPVLIPDHIRNLRTATFDLDSLYQDVPRNGDQLVLGRVSTSGGRPPGKDDDNDLPRGADKQAQIGDHRNDENLVIAQLHLAFLRFHNHIQATQQLSFEATQQVVRQHYQWIILHDFLKQICDNTVVERILRDGNTLFRPEDANFFIPLEFTAAAYRFGHSMVRTDYNFNLNFMGAGLDLLFRFTGLSGDLGGFSTLPENWIIQWENFLPFTTNTHEKARKFNTHLTRFLMQLPDGGVHPIMQSLAKRNLLRGYLLNLPSGQAIAQQLAPLVQVLLPQELLDNANAAERAVLEAHNFHQKTPLWYYILAEASIQQNGEKLGQLGSIIVAETIIGLMRQSKDSILEAPGWEPPTGKNFNLETLIGMAGVAP